MSGKKIAKTLKAAFREEMSAYRSLMRASAFRNPVGRAAIRSGNAARRKMAKAAALRLGLQMRCESEVREKRIRPAAASKKFRETAPWKSRGKRAS